MQEIISKSRYFERGLSKSLKKLFLFCLLNPVPFNRHDCEKQKAPGTSDYSIFRLKNKFRKIPLLVMYYLTKLDDVIESGFWVIQKITFANLCKPLHDIINYSIFSCPFESAKCGKVGEKITKIWISRKWKGFLDERFVIVFEGLSFGEKIRNSGNKLNFEIKLWMQKEQVQCSNGPQVLRLTSQTRQK